MQYAFPSGSSERRIILATGFAEAVQPVGAATITTDDIGLTVAEIQIPTSNGDIPAYSAKPSSGKLFPIVLVVHEIFGVHEHIKDICRRFAKLGYLAIAPELFARQGDVSTLTDFQEIISKVVSKTPDSQVISDLDAAAAYASSTLSGDPNRLAITGFCWGGRITWLYAAHSDQLQVGGAFYGRLIGQNSELQPLFPIDVAQKLKAPVQGFYGGLDQSISLDSVEAMQASLASVSSPSKITVFADAGHAFLADYRPSYKAEPAKEAWAQLLDWFKLYGV